MSQKKTEEKKAAKIKTGSALSSKRLTLLLCAVIVVITYFSFSPVLKNSFINWDDNAYVFENPHLNKKAPEAIKYFFGPHYFIGNYIPVTMLAFSAQHHLAGNNPHFFHAVNLFIHLANVLLVFWLIFLLSGKKPLVAAFVALFFGIHPVHVESVAWVSELKDMLYGFFFISALIAYFIYSEKVRLQVALTKTLSSLKPLVLAFILFVLSLLSKPAAIILPLVMLLLDFYSTRRLTARTWLEKLPFFAVSIVFGIVALKAQEADKLLRDLYPLSDKLLFACGSLINYVVKFFIPANLSIFYPYPAMVDGHLPYFYYAAPVLLAVIVFAAYRTLKQSRFVAFGLLFFFVNLILVLQVISVGFAVMADRYTYIPYIGLLFAIAMGFDNIYHSLKEKQGNLKQAGIAVTLALIIGCSVVTHARCKVWENEDSIANDLISKYPNDWLAINNKGFILFLQQKYGEAEGHYKKALELKPDYVMASLNLAKLYITINDIESAAKTADAAIRHSPNDANLQLVKAYVLFAKQDYEGARKLYTTALKQQSDNIGAHIYLAECYFHLKEYDKGIEVTDAALKQEPGNYILLNNKGYLLFLKGSYNDAVEYFKASLNINPDYKTASINLSDCYRAMGNTAEAKK